jgi:hypothetical protein
VPSAGAESVWRDSSSDEANEACGKDDPRKRDPEGKSGDERGDGDGPEERVAQRPRTNPVGREHNDRSYRRLDPVQDAGDGRDVTEREIDPRERDEEEQRRDHE